MRTLVLLTTLIFSLSAFANLDQFLGSYKPKRGKGVAVITKTVVTEATLFEPAKYEYRLSVEEVGPAGLYFEEKRLKVSEDGKSLNLETVIECDDPGCTYFDDIQVSVKKPASGKAQIGISYSAYRNGEGEERERSWFVDAVLYKK